VHRCPTRSYNESLHFSLYALRFQFTARGRLQFGSGKAAHALDSHVSATAANLVRGGLGAALRRNSCPPTCPRPGECPLSLQPPTACSYARLFMPRASFEPRVSRARSGVSQSTGPPSRGPRPSGLADWPRPFVLRTTHLEGETIEDGSSFHIGVHLFDLRAGAVSDLEAAFSGWGRHGLGLNRTEALLTAVEGASEPLHLFLDPSADPVSRIMVHFLTPTELKSHSLLPASPQESSSGAGKSLPPFELLAARIRDRLSTLSALYGGGPLPIDFRGFTQRAAEVQTVGGALHQVAAERSSRRTGQTHSLGGFVGHVEYQGDLAEFLPYLQAAAFTGVGRQTVWGKGEIRVASVS
jgi:hypothetical protein